MSDEEIQDEFESKYDENGRYISNPKIIAALKEMYGGSIPDDDSEKINE